MNIGVDIDNVIADFNGALLREYIKYDKSLRNNGIINKEAYITCGMFDFSKEENDIFYKENIERIVRSLELVDGAKEYIDKLIEDGNKIYIITGRENGEYREPQEMTIKWLKEKNIIYDKLIFTNVHDTHAKTVECIKNNIDIMIDDSSRILNDVVENKIKVLLMDTDFNKDEKRLKRVKSWSEIYDIISSNYKKINVIIDTDTYNETDDQFALSYLLKSKDKFNIEAITIAPFQNDRSGNDSGISRSYKEAKNVCRLCDVDTKNLIFKGATDYIKNGYDKRNDAVDEIIKIALKNNKTYILGIGAITNIALALKYEPKIAEKIEVVWLGGHTLLNNNNLHEANFKDIDAVKIVFLSNVKLTIIPCRGVASNLITSVSELNYYLKGKSDLCDFLCKRYEEYVNTKKYNRWPLWDIAPVAYMINKEWFETFNTNLPDIGKNTEYIINKNNREATIVNYIDVNKVYEDLYKKLLDK